MIGALFVDPAKRNLSIGHSLHQRALRSLLQKPGIQKLQLGLGLPGIYLGIPMSDLSEGARLKRWFANNGWNILSPRLLYTMTIRNLSKWIAPEDLKQTIQRVSFAFDLIQSQENSEVPSVLNHVRANAGPEILELYRLALEDSKECGVVRAKSPVDGALVGTIIICRHGTQLSRYLPVLHAPGESVGGLLAPVVPNSPQASMVLQGLAMLGINQNKVFGATTCVLSWVQGEERDNLLSMDFHVLDAFEQLSCSPDKVSLLWLLIVQFGLCWPELPCMNFSLFMVFMLTAKAAEFICGCKLTFAFWGATYISPAEMDIPITLVICIS
jgi:beta-N-acetylhexosaminidase